MYCKCFVVYKLERFFFPLRHRDDVYFNITLFIYIQTQANKGPIYIFVTLRYQFLTLAY